jgi:hypothetical protein
MDQLLDLLRRPPPEDETMSRVDISRFNRWVAQSKQDGVNVGSREVVIQKFDFLLCVSCGAMCRV